MVKSESFADVGVLFLSKTKVGRTVSQPHFGFVTKIKAWTCERNSPEPIEEKIQSQALFGKNFHVSKMRFSFRKNLIFSEFRQSSTSPRPPRLLGKNESQKTTRRQNDLEEPIRFDCCFGQNA